MRGGGGQNMAAAAAAAAVWIPACTHLKYDTVFLKVKRMKLREKRNFFASMREDTSDHNWFMPTYGMTAGLFSFFHVLTECPRRRTAQPSSSSSSSSSKKRPSRAPMVPMVPLPE